MNSTKAILLRTKSNCEITKTNNLKIIILTKHPPQQALFHFCALPVCNFSIS
jgi:hypothetical protein